MTNNARWPLVRGLLALGGTVTLLAAVLTAAVSRWLALLTVFVGISQWLYVFVGACPAAIGLRRTCHPRPAIYENGGATPVDRRAVGIV